jgi:hypothetical protein
VNVKVNIHLRLPHTTVVTKQTNHRHQKQKEEEEESDQRWDRTNGLAVNAISYTRIVPGALKTSASNYTILPLIKGCSEFG